MSRGDRRHSSKKTHHLFLAAAQEPSPTSRPVVVAVLGGDLSGVVAASKIASDVSLSSDARAGAAEVVLLTGYGKVLEGFKGGDSSPILPDMAMENRDLIERYANGGREMAGIFAKHCTLRQAKEWLEEEQGIALQDETTTMTTLLNEKPLFVSPKCNLQQTFIDNLERNHVTIKTHVNVTKISRRRTNTNNDLGGGFTLDFQRGESLQADFVILAGDCREIPTTPILASNKQATHTSTTTTTAAATAGSSSSSIKAASKTGIYDFDFDDDDEPMSLRDKMKQEKKRQSDAKKKKMDQLVQAEEIINVNELTKQELRTLTKKRKKEAQKKKQKQKQKARTNNYNEEDSDLDDDDNDGAINAAAVNDMDEKEGEKLQSTDDIFSFRGGGINTLSLAESLGHTVTSESLGCFSFMVPDRGLLEGCSKAIVPKARVRCKVDDDNNNNKITRRATAGSGGGGSSRLPKLESPLFLSQGEVSGPGACRLSTLIAHEMARSGHMGTLQIHFAPDLGSVEDLEATLLEVANPTASVLKSPCPLVHREVDYDDYDFETGDFRSVEFPLVPKDLWGNLCRQAGITTAKLKWKDLPPSSIQSLARLMVDCQLSITGIRPQEDVMAGGVNLKELNMAECQSQLVKGLFLCGSTIDVHGFDGGFNSLASLATGYVAGTNAIAAIKEVQ